MERKSILGTWPDDLFSRVIRWGIYGANVGVWCSSFFTCSSCARVEGDTGEHHVCPGGQLAAGE